MTLRVINVGLPKTGTTTLARALRRAGLKTADYRIRAHQTDLPEQRKAYVADLLYRGYFETGDPGAYLAGFDAVTEMSLLRDGRSLWPQTDFALISALRQYHPGVKLLASHRDPFRISQSMLGWSDMGLHRLPESAVPGLPEGFGTTTAERVRWIEGHYAHLRALFGDDPDFLEYDVADPDARTKVAAFLGRDLPWWGRANRSKLDTPA